MCTPSKLKGFMGNNSTLSPKTLLHMLNTCVFVSLEDGILVNLGADVPDTVTCAKAMASAFFRALFV